MEKAVGALQELKAPLEVAKARYADLDAQVATLALRETSLRGIPLVTVIDGASHSLAFLGGCLGVRSVPLGVDRYGQVGSLAAVYEAYDLSPEAIATAALIALEP